MRSREVKVKFTLSLEIDPILLFLSLAGALQGAQVLASFINTELQDALTPPGVEGVLPEGVGLPGGKLGCSQLGNLSLLISFLEILLTAWVPKERMRKAGAKEVKPPPDQLGKSKSGTGFPLQY